MSDSKKYRWLSKDVLVDPSDSQMGKVLDALDQSSNPDFQKEALARYALENAKSDTLDFNHLNQTFKRWMSGNAYRRSVSKVVENDQTKYMMSGIVMVMTGTICIYFLRAILMNAYLVNFSFDAIMGSIAIAFLIVNVRKKYQVIRRYSKPSDYALMDLLSFGISFLLKFIIPPMFDLSVLILFLAYYIQKRRFATEVKKVVG